MPEKDTIEPIDDDFDSVSEAVISPNKGLKEIRINTNKIKLLPAKSRSKGITSQTFNG